MRTKYLVTADRFAPLLIRDEAKLVGDSRHFLSDGETRGEGDPATSISKPHEPPIHSILFGYIAIQRDYNTPHV